MYADVTVAPKNKKLTVIPKRPTVSTTQPDRTVEYSSINFKLCNKKPVNVEEHPSHGNMIHGKSIIIIGKREYPTTLWYCVTILSRVHDLWSDIHMLEVSRFVVCGHVT